MRPMTKSDSVLRTKQKIKDVNEEYKTYKLLINPIKAAR